jgi:regulator of sirC expression with transglutaminase-like and TPR domain
LATEPVLKTEAARLDLLIRQLDDDSFEVRRRAQRELIALGEPALPAIRAVFDSRSAEVRSRVREIARQIEHERLLKEFRLLVRPTSDAAIDLEAGLVLAAQIIEPDIRRDKISAQLDALAQRVRQQLNGAGKDVDPQVGLAALRQVLFVEEGFDGNRNDYDNPANSSIGYVLETKRGLPILLSQVVIAVGRRLDLPVVGLALPGRFIVKYEDRRVGDRAARIGLLIDPFEGGRNLTLVEFRRYFPEYNGEPENIRRLLAPAGNRQTLVRVLNNISAAYAIKDDYRRAMEVEAYRDVIFQENLEPAQ